MPVFFKSPKSLAALAVSLLLAAASACLLFRSGDTPVFAQGGARETANSLYSLISELV